MSFNSRSPARRASWASEQIAFNQISTTCQLIRISGVARGINIDDAVLLVVVVSPWHTFLASRKRNTYWSSLYSRIVSHSFSLQIFQIYRESISRQLNCIRWTWGRENVAFVSHFICCQLVPLIMSLQLLFVAEWKSTDRFCHFQFALTAFKAQLRNNLLTSLQVSASLQQSSLGRMNLRFVADDGEVGMM